MKENVWNLVTQCVRPLLGGATDSFPNVPGVSTETKASAAAWIVCSRSVFMITSEFASS